MKFDVGECFWVEAKRADPVDEIGLKPQEPWLSPRSKYGKALNISEAMLG